MSKTDELESRAAYMGAVRPVDLRQEPPTLDAEIDPHLASKLPLLLGKHRLEPLATVREQRRPSGMRPGPGL